MPDTKISALTALAGASIATDDEIPIVDTSATATKKTTMADLSSRTETMTNKTLTTPTIDGGTINTPTIDEAVISGTPDAEGELGRDTTQLALNDFNNGMLGVRSRVIAAGVGAQTFINDVATDQDFTSIFTFPANTIFASKAYRVSIIIENISGTSSATLGCYLKLGATKVYTSIAVNAGDGLTRSGTFVLTIIGREAPGAAANVTTANINPRLADSNTMNTTNQPVALATNGTLAVTPGVVWSGTGSTESCELQGWIIEELN